MNKFSEMIIKIAGIAVYSAILDVFAGEATGGMGFRSVCGLAIMLVIAENFLELLGI